MGLNKGHNKGRNAHFPLACGARLNFSSLSKSSCSCPHSAASQPAAASSHRATSKLSPTPHATHTHTYTRAYARSITPAINRTHNLNLNYYIFIRGISQSQTLALVASCRCRPRPCNNKHNPPNPHATGHKKLLAAGAMEQAAFDKTQIDLAAVAARRRHPLRHPAPRVSP